MRHELVSRKHARSVEITSFFNRTVDRQCASPVSGEVTKGFFVEFDKHIRDRCCRRSRITREKLNQQTARDKSFWKAISRGPVITYSNDSTTDAGSMCASDACSCIRWNANFSNNDFAVVKDVICRLKMLPPDSNWRACVFDGRHVL